LNIELMQGTFSTRFLQTIFYKRNTDSSLSRHRDFVNKYQLSQTDPRDKIVL